MPDPNADYDVGLLARPGHEGPQIVLNWGAPVGDWDELVLARRLGDYPSYIEAPAAASGEFRVTVGGDDSVSTDVYFPFNWWDAVVWGTGKFVTSECWTGFVRFRINLPRGSTVTSASVQAYAWDIIGSQFNAQISIADVDDAGDMSLMGSVFLDPLLPEDPLVTPIVWPTPTVAGLATTPDLSTLVQRFIDRPGYRPGQHICFRFTCGDAASTNAVTFLSKDYPSIPEAYVATLSVGYDAPHTSDGVVLFVAKKEVYEIAAEGDDGTGTSVAFDDTQVRFGIQAGVTKHGFVRYALNLKPSDVIASAELRVKPTTNPTGIFTSLIQVLDVDDADYSSNPFATAVMADAEAGLRFPISQDALTIEIKALVEAFIGRTGYAIGNHIGIRIGAGNANPGSYATIRDYGANQPARLTVISMAPVGALEELVPANLYNFSDRDVVGGETYYYSMFVKRADTGAYVKTSR